MKLALGSGPKRLFDYSQYYDIRPHMYIVQKKLDECMYIVRDTVRTCKVETDLEINAFCICAASKCSMIFWDIYMLNASPECL